MPTRTWGFTLEVVTVDESTSRGVAVETELVFDVFAVPAVATRVTSNRQRRSTVTLAQELPSDLSIDQLYFHPAYGADGWRVAGEGWLYWTGTLEPSESVRVLYGVTVDEYATLRPLLEPPGVETVRAHGDDASGSVNWRTSSADLVAEQTVNVGSVIERGSVSAEERRSVVDALDLDVAGAATSTTGDDREEHRSVADLIDDANPPLDPSRDVLALRIELDDRATQVRPITLYRELENALDVLATDPTPGRIVDGDHDGILRAIVATDIDPSSVRSALTDIDVVGGLDIEDVTDSVEVDESRERPDPAADFAELQAEFGPDADEPGVPSGFTGPDDEVTLSRLVDEFEEDDNNDEVVAEAPDGQAITSGGDEAVVPVDAVSWTDGGIHQDEAFDRSDVAVRLATLESHVSRLAAYADAIQEFLDEDDTAASLVGDVGRGLDHLTTGLESIHDDVEELESTVSDLEDRVDRLEDEAVRTEEFGETVATLDDRIDETRERHEDALAELSTVVEDATAKDEQIVAGMRTLVDRIERVETVAKRVGRRTKEFEAIRRQVRSAIDDDKENQ